MICFLKLISTIEHYAAAIYMKKVLILICCFLIFKASSIFATEGILVTGSDSEESVELPLWFADQSKILQTSLQDILGSEDTITFSTLSPDQIKELRKEKIPVPMKKAELNYFTSLLTDVQKTIKFGEVVDASTVSKYMSERKFSLVELKTFFKFNLALESDLFKSPLICFIFDRLKDNSNNCEENKELNKLLFYIHDRNKRYLKTLIPKMPTEFKLEPNYFLNFCSSNFSSLGNRAAAFEDGEVTFFSIDENAVVKKDLIFNMSWSNYTMDASLLNNNNPLITFSPNEEECLIFSPFLYLPQIFNLKRTIGDSSENKKSFKSNFKGYDNIKSAAFSPKTTCVAIQPCGAITDHVGTYLAQYENGKLKDDPWWSGEDYTNSTFFSNDGSLLVTTGYDHVKIWTVQEDGKGAQLLHTFGDVGRIVHSAVLSPQNNCIAITVSTSSAGINKYVVIIYDLKNKENVCECDVSKLSKDSNIYCWFDSSERFFSVTGRASQTIKIWDLKNTTKKPIEVTFDSNALIRHAVGHPRNDMAIVVYFKTDTKETFVRFIPDFFNGGNLKFFSYLKFLDSLDGQGGRKQLASELQKLDEEIPDDALIFVPNNPSVSASQFKKFIPLLKNVGFGILGIFVAYLGVKATAFISKAYRFNTPFNVQIRNLVTLFKNTGEEIFLKKLRAIYMRHAVHK